MKTPEIQKHSNKFQTALKHLSPAYLTIFVFSYMLFIFEPLLMYSSNKLDLWFDLSSMIAPLLIGYLLIFFSAIAITTAAYLVIRRFIPKRGRTVFRIITLALIAAFIETYLQGTFLSSYLPPLDGSIINWNSFVAENILTWAMIVLLAALSVYFPTKIGLRKTVKYGTFVVSAVFVMLTVSLVIEMISRDPFWGKGNIATNTNFNTMSSDKNFVIFMTDSIGSSEFMDILDENPEYKKDFEDFTYFPDTLGCYPCTRNTVPLILSGELNKNEMEFNDFSTRAFNGSPFFQELSDRGYEINLYESELIWYGDMKYKIGNCMNNIDYEVPLELFAREQSKYIAYKYLPFPLKFLSKIESMDFNGVPIKYSWDDPVIYKIVNDSPVLNKTDKKSFRFIHTEGAHIPFLYDKDLNDLTFPGTYEEKIEASIKMVNAYIKRLKENNAYDNTVIVIMSDHGNSNLKSSDDMLIRANPMFMVKGVNEHHEFALSDKPVSYLDLMDIYSRLLDDNTADEAFAGIPDSRERLYMWYDDFGNEDHLEEYVVTDKAWEWEKFKKTGKIYDLER